MQRGWKSRALYFGIGLIVGAGVWCGLNYERLYEMNAPSGSKATQTAQGKANSHESKTTMHSLPQIPEIRGEEQLRQVVRDYADYLEASSGQTLEESKLKLAAILKEAWPLKDGDLPMLYMYKYPLRSALEKLQKLDPQLVSLGSQAQALVDKKGHWNVQAKGWQFEPFEEAVYQTYFTDKNKDFPLSRSLEILLAIRSRDYNKMQELHNQIGLGPAPQWPLEAFRQLYAYATSEGGSMQMEELKKLLPEGKNWQGADWCEIGYGSGKIFSALRNEIGNQGIIWAVEIDSSCKRFAQDLLASGFTDWGNIKFIDGSYRDCHMPAKSVDVVHAGLIHIGDGPDELIQRDWLPLLASIKKALKEDGLVLIDDGGDPPIERVRAVMKMAGFKEVKMVRGRHTDAQHPCFVAAFTPEK